MDLPFSILVLPDTSFALGLLALVLAALCVTARRRRLDTALSPLPIAKAASHQTTPFSERKPPTS